MAPPTRVLVRGAPGRVGCGARQHRMHTAHSGGAGLEESHSGGCCGMPTSTPGPIAALQSALASASPSVCSGAAAGLAAPKRCWLLQRDGRRPSRAAEDGCTPAGRLGRGYYYYYL